MFDGINLQSVLYSIFIFLIFIYKGIFIELTIIMLIPILFFLYLNFKNKCFLGDNGAILISFIISFFFIKSYLFYDAFYADEIFLIMLIPGLDLLRLAVFRILHGKHPFKPDRNHIHHILLNNFGFAKTIIIINVIIVFPTIISYYFGHTIYFIAFSILSYSLLIYKYFNKNF
jgi:UDP-GlcNAc:undecaprenyl-phosphate GlcNAc-1-phosphate transferase